MKNLFNKNKIAIISMVFFAILIFIIPVYTHAQQGGKERTEGNVTIVERIALSGINNFLAGIGNGLLSLTSWLLSISGYFLNQALTLTLNIGDYTKSTNMPVIGDIWKTVRNISNIFIIFFLIYSSISIIIGSGVETTKKLIFNIIIAGMLINFSLFFVRVGIDASNLVSMQFYRAMIPNSTTNAGISDVFMSSLKIPQIYQNTAVLKSADAGLAIFIATISGVIMMITAAFSFLAAGIAIFARTGILLFLMALSPFYFVGMIFPQIEQEVSKRLKEMFTHQLLFLPVYLCLMYIALRLISSPDFNSIFNTGANSNGVIPPGEGPFGVTSIGVTIQYIIAIIFINAPLIAALKFGAVGAKWAPGLGIATGFAGWMGGIGKNMAGFVGQNVVGRGASKASDSLMKSSFAAKNPTLALMSKGVLKNVSGSTFGGTKGGFDDRKKKYVKERTELVNKSLKISDEEKKAYTDAGIVNWNSENEKINKSIALQTFLSNSNNIEIKNEARKKLGKLLGEKKAREKAENEGKIKEYLEGQAERDKKESIAKDFEKKSTIGYFTENERKEIAKNIRAEMNKSEEKKALELLKKAMKDGDDDGKEGGKGGGDDKKGVGDKGGKGEK